MNPAVFLDRDGVIIENVDDYVRSWSDVRFLPGSLAGLAALGESPYKIVVVTNQAVVGRKLLSLEQVGEINNRIVAEIERAGGRLDGVYICPHAAEEQCICRKPRPGLILQAAAELGIDLNQSFLIGDALTDLDAGQRAGVARCWLVLSGRGAVQARLPEASALAPFQIYERMETAVEAILSGNY